MSYDYLRIDTVIVLTIQTVVLVGVLSNFST